MMEKSIREGNAMNAQRAVIHPLSDHLYLIDDAGESTCYLLIGREKAMLIDTANGREDLHAIVRGLTQLPLVIVNTHGHVDHVCGNVYFAGAYLHPDDLPIAREHLGYAKEEFDKAGLKPCPFLPLCIGDLFDLGGIEVEVVSLRGHTPGSVGLIDLQDRILFSSDGLNTHLWMQLDHSTSIRTLHTTLLDLQKQHGQKFDRILTGHGKDFYPYEIFDQLIAGCEDLLSGRTQADMPYRYFGGECLQHPLSSEPGHCIVYSADKL